MHWEVISNERSSLQEYRLIVNSDCKVVIKYNSRHHSARITCSNHHRLFFLESAGSLSGKTVFKNQYGIEAGNLVHDKFHPQEGTLVLDSKKYRYHLQHNRSPALVIFENDPQKPVANCRIPTKKTNTQNIFSGNTDVINNNCYLLGLCWYLFLPLGKENIEKYASVSF